MLLRCRSKCIIYAWIVVQLMIGGWGGGALGMSLILTVHDEETIVRSKIKYLDKRDLLFIGLSDEITSLTMHEALLTSNVSI